MADKLLIVIASIDLTTADRLQLPLSQAATAAAMDYEVEVIFSGQASQLVFKKNAQTICTRGEDVHTVLQLIQHTKIAGVKFKVCSTAMDAVDNSLIDEMDETVGNAYLITEAMDDSVVTFTY
jgi:uncharacterized protein